MKEKPKKPVVGDKKVFTDHEGNPAFEVSFIDEKTVKIKRVGKPNILREIVPKYGNIRKVDGQMHQTADLTLWFLFNLTESN